MADTKKSYALWIAHWAGSNPYKGWSIRQGRDEIIWLGETVSSEEVEAIVMAHNKCFDCNGGTCVMNCSGKLAAQKEADIAAFGSEEKASEFYSLGVALNEANKPPSAMGHSTPEGWKLVPIEPTEEMLDAVVGPNAGGTAQAYAAFNYRAMLAAAHSLSDVLPVDRKWVVSGAIAKVSGYRNCDAPRTKAVMQEFVDYMNAALADARDSAIERCAEEADVSARQYAREAQGGDSSGASDHKEAAAREIAADIRALKSRAF